MRFERKIAVMVLATGVILSAAAVAASPTDEATPASAASTAQGAAATPPPAPESPKPVPKGQSKPGFVAWKPAELKPEHAILQGLVGKFTTKVHLYSGPYPRFRDTEGSAEGRILLGGPFV